MEESVYNKDNLLARFNEFFCKQYFSVQPYKGGGAVIEISSIGGFQFDNSML